MIINEAELECILWYRGLSAREKLAVRRYAYLGDARLLPGFGEHRERLDCIRRLAVAQRPNEDALFGA